MFDILGYKPHHFPGLEWDDNMSTKLAVLSIGTQEKKNA